MKQFFSIVILSAALFACGTKDKEAKEATINKQDYQQQKESLLSKEKKAPKEFLSISGKDHRNILGQTVFKGVIHNSATVCSYKKVRVKLLYYKSDGTLVTNHEEEFDETVKPIDDIEFKAKYKTPRGTDSVSAYIMSAVAE